MRELFYPSSIVIVGVSESPSNLAQMILQNLDDCGFTGRVHCVGRRPGRAKGREILESVDRIEGIPDVAVLLVPAQHVEGALEACGEKGIPYVVVQTGGFSELGDERGALEARLRESARRLNIRLVGPNCVGVVNAENGLTMPFYPVEPSDLIRGNVSFVSQSGGLIHDVLKRCAYDRLGLSKLVSIGNKLMLDENDFLSYFLDDPATGVVGFYLESLSDGRRLMDLVESTEKPVVVVRGNRSQAAREIARFHTAALAGDEQVATAALEQCGAHEAEGLAEMVDFCKVFQLPLLKGNRLALVSRSGGQAVLLADAAQRHGFELAPLSPRLRAFLDERFGTRVIRATNPIDLGDVFDLDLYAEVLERLLTDDVVDGVVLFHYYPNIEAEATERMLSAAAQASRRVDKPLVLCVLPQRAEALRAGNPPYLLFDDADPALRGLKASVNHYQALLDRRARAASGHRPFPDGLPRRSVAPAGGTRREGPVNRRLVPVAETFNLLASYGLEVAHHEVVASVQQALEAAERIGYPVALKVASPEILHKTEQGAVRLNIEDASALRAAMAGMKAHLYLVQRMAPGVEIIVGGRQDPQFGPVVLVGTGGVLAELLQDVTVRVAPFDAQVARGMLAEIRGSGLLDGFRGAPPRDRAAVVRCLLSVARLLVEHPEIVNLDINPLTVQEEGRGCVVVDAKAEREEDPGG